MEAIQEVFRTRGGFSAGACLLEVACFRLVSFSSPCTDVSVLSFEFPAAVLIPVAAAPDDTDTDDKSCTSYSDSCELVLMSRLERLAFFPLSRLAGCSSMLWLLLGSTIVGCCCRGTSVLSVLASGAVLTEPTDSDEDEGELTIRSKLSSVELIEVLLLN